MEVIRIADPLDPRVVLYAGLTDRAARRSVESTEGVFVAEGAHALRQLIASPFEVASVLVATNRLDGVAADLDVLAATGIPVYVAEPEVLVATTGFAVHRGVLALGRRRAPEDPTAVLDAAAPSGVVVVVEGVNDHENLGALFRNAAAFGAGAVLADPTTADPYYRRSIRVSSGHVLRIPFARLDPWPAGLDLLTAKGWTTLALTPDRSAEPVDDVARSRPPLLALVVGAEGPGLTEPTLARARRRVRIPLAPGVDSLNVATAAAVALHRLASLPGA